MADFSPLNSDAAISRFQAAGENRALSAAKADMRRGGHSDAHLKKTCEQFESLLLDFMIREMRATVPESQLFPQSMADKIYTGMLDQRYAGEMAKNGGLGISRMIFDQLKREE
jgi:peptidoglycan hydrolase FlgJ